MTIDNPKIGSIFSPFSFWISFFFFDETGLTFRVVTGREIECDEEAFRVLALMTSGWLEPILLGSVFPSNDKRFGYFSSLSRMMSWVGPYLVWNWKKQCKVKFKFERRNLNSILFQFSHVPLEKSAWCRYMRRRLERSEPYVAPVDWMIDRKV